LNKGKTVAYGKSNEALSKENLEKAYSIDVYSLMQGLLGSWNGAKT
jgi:ABC-type cobalamin/Fe3+-siderophores transport system ATPase subunit